MSLLVLSFTDMQYHLAAWVHEGCVQVCQTVLMPRETCNHCGMFLLGSSKCPDSVSEADRQQSPHLLAVCVPEVLCNVAQQHCCVGTY